MMNGELLQARIEIGNDAARLERHAGLAAEFEIMLDHGCGVAEDRIGIARGKGMVESEIGSELSVDGSRASLQLRPPSRRWRAIPPIRSRSVRSRLPPVRGSPPRPRRPARPAKQTSPRASGNWVGETWPGNGASLVCHGRQTAASSSPVTTAITPGMSGSFDGVDCNDARMCMRLAQECGVAHACQHDVVGIAAVAGNQTLRLRARHPRADHALCSCSCRGCPRACPSPPRSHRRWRDSRCSGSNCRTARRGWPRATASGRSAFRPRLQAFPACNSRIAGHCGRRTPPAGRRSRRFASALRWFHVCSHRPALRASGSFAPNGLRASHCRRRRRRVRSRYACRFCPSAPRMKIGEIACRTDTRSATCSPFKVKAMSFALVRHRHRAHDADR